MTLNLSILKSCVEGFFFIVFSTKVLQRYLRKVALVLYSYSGKKYLHLLYVVLTYIKTRILFIIG